MAATSGEGTKRRRLLDWADLVGVPWIAAVAARNGTTILTCDDHFERIGRVGSIVIDS